MGNYLVIPYMQCFSSKIKLEDEALLKTTPANPLFSTPLRHRKTHTVYSLFREKPQISGFQTFFFKQLNPFSFYLYKLGGFHLICIDRMGSSQN